MVHQYHLAGISLSYTFSNPSNIHSLQAGVSNNKTHNPITKNTYFQVASVTKAFITSILLRNVEQGKIALDDTLKDVANQYPGNQGKLKKLVNQYPHLGTITLRQFMTHTSGIAQCLNSQTFIKTFNKNPGVYLSPKQLVSIAMQHKPYFQPGEKDYYGYTNTDYIILGIVIEALSNQSLVSTVNQFLSNIGLAKLYFPGPRAKDMPDTVKQHLAQAYIPKQTKPYTLKAFHHLPTTYLHNTIKAKNVTEVVTNYGSIGAAAGGIFARTQDLVKWYWLLFHNKVVSQKSLHKMLKGVPTAHPNKKYGLGIIIQQTQKYGTIYSHDGNTFGYETNLLYVPDMHLIMAVATNTATDHMSKTTQGIVGSLLQVIRRQRQENTHGS